jgi:hypothetical protein
MDSAIEDRVRAAVCAIQTSDLARIGRIIIDVLVEEGAETGSGFSLEEIKRLLVAAVRLGKALESEHVCSGLPT